MRFPVTIKHRTSKVKIYAPCKGFNYYRLAFTAAGKRQSRSFKNYSEAKTIITGVQDKRLMVVESEFASVLSVSGREGSTLSEVLRNAWDSGDIQNYGCRMGDGSKRFALIPKTGAANSRGHDG